MPQLLGKIAERKRKRAPNLAEAVNRTIGAAKSSVNVGIQLHGDIDALQADLDDWLTHYNETRTHQGKMCCRRTPLETLVDGKAIWKEKFIN